MCLLAKKRHFYFARTRHYYFALTRTSHNMTLCQLFNVKRQSAEQVTKNGQAARAGTGAQKQSET